MDNNDDVNVENHEINLHKIIEDRHLLSVTRLLATTLLYKPYMLVGDFVSSLSDDDLTQLMDIAEQLERNDGAVEYGDIPHLEELVLITELLVRAEGLTTPNVDVLTARIGAFSMFLACEGLCRKGLIKLYHKNMSFGEDMGHKILVEKIEGIDLDDYI